MYFWTTSTVDNKIVFYLMWLYSTQPEDCYPLPKTTYTWGKVIIYTNDKQLNQTI